jgi:hypothetical protein
MIEKGIALPQKFPFAGMKVGDSFAVPEKVKRVTVSVAARRYGIKNEMKFTVRKIEDGSFRCWRIA